MKSNKMKAIICTKYGGPEVLQLQEIEKPSPKTNEVLIKINTTTVTAADNMMRKGAPYIGRLFIGLTKPKFPITGTGLSGEIIAIGAEVTEFKVGDEVFGESLLGVGTNAEYICVSEDGTLAKKPSNMTHEQLASVCDGPLTSLNLLKNKANIKSGQKILIIGASGSLGTAGVQLAKHFGAEVTGVCSTGNLEMVKSLGADYVIDYTTTDFTKNGQTYDIIYDAVGKSSFTKCKKSLPENGIFLSPVMSFSLLFQMMKTSVIGRKKVKFDATGMRPTQELRKMLQELKALLEGGELKTVIDKYYTLEQVAEAHKYVDKGRKKGNIVITVKHNN